MKRFLLSISIYILIQGSILANEFICPVGHPFTGEPYEINNGFDTTYKEGFTYKDKRYYGHTGVDFVYGSPSKCGGLVRAAGAGRVRAAGSAGDWGNRVRIEHILSSGNKVYSLYAHMNANLLVRVDQEVCMGQPLGFVDTTGLSTGCHLHFAIKNGDSDGIGYAYDDPITDNYNPIDYIHQNLSNTPPCNSLARTRGKDEVYWYQNGKAYYVLSPDILTEMKNIPGWADIWDYTDDIFSIHPPKILSPDFISKDDNSYGLLIRQYGNQEGRPVYRIENGKKRHITSPETFNQRHYDWKDIIEVSANILNQFDEGLPISPEITKSGVIDFEDFRAKILGGLGGDQPINDYYAGSGGVNFTGATSLSKADDTLSWESFPPHSGDALIFDTSWGTGEINIIFTVPATTVGGYFTYNTQLILEALDSKYRVVQTKYSAYSCNSINPCNEGPPNEYIELSSESGIKALRIRDSGNTYTLDDLTINNVLTDTYIKVPNTFQTQYQDLDLIDQIETKWKDFYNDSIQTLQLLLNWGGSSFKINVYRPDGSLYDEIESNSPPIEIDIPNAEIGMWKYEIMPTDIPYNDYPFALVVGILDDDMDGLSDQTDNCPSSPNGPNGGTCTAGLEGQTCMSDFECGSDGYCSMHQEDTDGDGAGDVCDRKPECPIIKVYGNHSATSNRLRHFRDNVLGTTPEGREMIKMYYQWSPYIVKAMEEDEAFKEWVKYMIESVLPMIE